MQKFAAIVDKAYIINPLLCGKAGPELICSLVGCLCIDYGASENAFLDQSICRVSVFNLKIGVQFRFLSMLHLIRYIKSLGPGEQLIGKRQ